MNSLRLSCRPRVSSLFLHAPNPKYAVWVGDTTEPPKELIDNYLITDKYNFVSGWENIQIIRKGRLPRR